MQRFINDPDYIVVDDTVRGFVKAHADLVKLGGNPQVVAAAKRAECRARSGVDHRRRIRPRTRVHRLCRPQHARRGRGRRDRFPRRPPRAFTTRSKIADGGRGVVCLYGNYAGDNMNVKMAVKLAAKDGLEVLTVVANDDVSSRSAQRARKAPRRRRRNLHVEMRRRESRARRAA